MEGVSSLKILYEKQTRRFYLFLILVCVLQICFLGICSIFQTQNIRAILAEREFAAASCLLEKGVSPELVASAWSHLKPVSVSGIFILPAAGLSFALVILAGTAVFLWKRERIYEEAGQVIAYYAEGRFGKHLPAGQTGTLYQLFGSIEQLAQSLQSKSEMEHKAKTFLRDMISNISHQLKTPLAALSMYMEIITEEPWNEEEVKNFSQKSMQSVERMKDLVHALLKMARLDAGSITFEKRDCLILDIIEQGVSDLMERAKCEDKQILLDGKQEEKLFCDPRWMREAVGNLVKNALDHTAAGGVIRVSWQETPVVFRLTVTDNGSGIEEEDIHHIFKQFYRSKSSGERQGAGLGLSLARSIVEGQGGNLSVESSLGEGSRFCMTF